MEEALLTFEQALHIQCFTWKHNMKDKDYDKYFDYHTTKFSAYEAIIRKKSVTLLNEDNKISTLSFEDFGHSKELIANHILYDSNLCNYIVKHNKYTYFATRYLDDNSHYVTNIY